MESEANSRKVILTKFERVGNHSVDMKICSFYMKCQLFLPLKHENNVSMTRDIAEVC